MIVTVTPADLRLGDRVLINGGWWTVDRVGAAMIGPDRTVVHPLRLSHDGDSLAVWRPATAPLTVDRAEL